MARHGNAHEFATASAVAAASTAMTLWHRLPMFGFTSPATMAERRAETVRMVDEKTTAFVEGSLDASLEAYRALCAAMMGQFAPLMNAPLAIACASLTPAFHTVNANAKRLNRRAIKSALGN
jgi:hypothetical protein